MADWHFARAQTLADLVAAHEAWGEDYNAQRHRAHENREDGRRVARRWRRIVRHAGTILDMPSEPEESRWRPTPDRRFGTGTVVALLAWGLIILAFSAGGLADVTGLWWLVLLFGLAAPVALLAVRHRATANGAVGGTKSTEGEVLAALREYGELTPTAAAMLTSLTAAEAAKALEGLAREGHLEARARDGAISYALREGDLRSVSGARPEASTEPPGEAPKDAASPARTVEPLLDPLTERELAVLKLVAARRTNREVAEELFVAEGTVKAHVASIYRKLGVHSRAEAVSRASDLNLT